MPKYMPKHEPRHLAKHMYKRVPAGTNVDGGMKAAQLVREKASGKFEVAGSFSDWGMRSDVSLTRV